VTLAPLREDDLVARLRLLAGEPDGRRIVVGIGDDAAVWQPSRSHRSVITTDALVEGVHFARETMGPYDAGWRAAVANVSDLAAMGARPVLATTALGISPTWSTQDVLELYGGMVAAANLYGLVIVGGDLTRSPVMTVAMTAVGEVRPSRVTLRSRGRAGDVIASTGDFGASRAGFDVARGAVSFDQALERQALEAHRRPRARLREGRWLAASAHVHAVIDCSDGLSTDLARLCEASGSGAVLDGVPVAAAAAEAARALGVDAEGYALAGGEEYELIVAVERRAFAYLSRRYRARFGQTLRTVGTLRTQPGVVRRLGTQETPLVRTGWDHFSPG
jgi:thiamine-monophosphate kinase